MTLSPAAARAQEVAKVILSQFGGGRFSVMTGAKSFLSGDDEGNPFLSFRLPGNFACQGINYVKVKLMPSDTYDVTFGKVRGTGFRVIAAETGIYAEDLRQVFTQATGLTTSL